MLGKAKAAQNSAASVLVEEPVAAKPAPVLVGTELAEYVRMADAIGWSPASLLEQRLRNFFEEIGICIFPYEKVEAYLDQKFGKCKEPYSSDTTWGWRPLRQVDIDVRNDELFLRKRNGMTLNAEYYHGPIPPPVIMTVEKVAAQFPGAHFFVSDVPTQADRTQYDPFLAVSAPGMNFLVVERWEEPGFRM